MDNSELTKDEIDEYLKILGKELKKQKVDGELVI